MSTGPLTPIELRQRRLKQRLLRRGQVEQRHAGAKLQIVGRMKNGGSVLRSAIFDWADEGLALSVQLACALSQEHLDTAISGAARLGVVVGNGLMGAAAVNLDALSAHATGNKVIACAGSPVDR